MDGGESSAPKLRKRTESIGGSSDSELSEGWNIIDHTDVTNHDVTSSDGESVEVIDAEDESRENEFEGDTSLAPVMDIPVVAHTEPESPSVPEEAPAPQEEMFDSSFRWFLIYATAAVLFSNIAFLVADYVLVWNGDQEIDAPSFLRDLPTTPKLGNENKLIQNIPWDIEEEATGEILDNGPFKQHRDGKNGRTSQYVRIDKNHPHKLSAERVSKNKDVRFSKNSKESFKKQHFEKVENINDKGNNVVNEDKLDFSYNNFDNHDIGKYITALNEVTTSTGTKAKFNQVFLILDELQIGLNDKELVATDNSELKNLFKSQKHQLSQVLTDMQYDVSKSLDRVATSVLNKVWKLRKRFQYRWCELERRGYQDELTGLFYDCQEGGEKDHNEGHTISDHFEVKSSTKQPSRVEGNLDIYHYQVDKDSPGKEHANAHANEMNEVDDYIMMLKSEMNNNKDFTNKDLQENSKSGNLPIEEPDQIKLNNIEKENFENNGKNSEKFYKHVKFDRERKYEDTKKNVNYGNQKLYNEKNYDKQRQNTDKEKNNYDKGKYNDDRKKYYNDGGKHYDDRRRYNNDKNIYVDDKVKFLERNSKYEERKSQDKIKHGDKRSKDNQEYAKRFENYSSAEKNGNHNKKKGKDWYTRSDKSVFNVEPIPEVIEKYFKESCEKGEEKLKNMYDKLKSLIASKLRVPKNIFDLWYAKYCRVNDDSFKWDKRLNREHPKGDFSGKNKKYFKDEPVIGDLDKNVRILEVSEIDPEDGSGDPAPASDNIIIPDTQPRQWVFQYEESNDNQSNLTGEWFSRSGEARSKLRWSNQRGDWWFERASHRRTQPRNIRISRRHKNWYFRRAWARQNCRHNPHEEWCIISEEEKLTVPNPSVNLR